MGSGGAWLLASSAALLVIASCALTASAAKYTVGDTSGWTTGTDYTTWASDKKLKVGDSLGQYIAITGHIIPFPAHILPSARISL